MGRKRRHGTTTSLNYVVDTVVPTATIVGGRQCPHDRRNLARDDHLSEAVAGFTNADLTVRMGRCPL